MSEYILTVVVGFAGALPRLSTGRSNCLFPCTLMAINLASQCSGTSKEASRLFGREKELREDHKSLIEEGLELFMEG